MISGPSFMVHLVPNVGSRTASETDVQFLPQRAPCSGMGTWTLDGLPCHKLGLYMYIPYSYIEPVGLSSPDAICFLAEVILKE